MNHKTSLTYLGHSAFKIKAGDAVILIDPFLSASPTFKDSKIDYDETIHDVTHILLTHGHDDHVGDTLAIAKATGAEVIAMVELCLFLNNQGVDNTTMTNLGGTVQINENISVTFVQAHHSSSTMVDGQNVYLGAPAGLIITTPDDTIYHMGDTDIFGDMELIDAMYEPTIGLVPIGDKFTMGAQTAAIACTQFFNFDTIVPIHYGTFPGLDKKPDSFAHAYETMANANEEHDAADVRALKIGETL